MTSSNSITSNHSDETRTALYAQDAAFYLQSAFATPGPSGIQALRCTELKQKLACSERKEIPSPEVCSFCGTLMIDGWTGTMQLSNVKPGLRKRKLRQSLEPEQQVNHRNRLEWKCQTCGSKLLCARSDPNTKAKFAPVKRHKPISTLLRASAANPTKIPVQSGEQRMYPVPTNETVTAARIPDKIKRPDLPSPSVVKPVPSWLQPAPKKAADSPLEAKAKKRRTKKEGLQALLQAKKEQEEKEKRSASGLGLSSFLQGLQ